MECSLLILEKVKEEKNKEWKKMAGKSPLISPLFSSSPSFSAPPSPLGLAVLSYTVIIFMIFMR